MNSRKTILMVGAGGIGLKHLKAINLLEPRPRVVVMDPRDESRARAAELGAEPLNTDWESLDLSQFDGVLICAPAPWHVPYALRCLKEGIPVLSEKPLSHSWEGVEELVEASEKPGAPPSGVAYVRRYHPAYERIRNFLLSGELGPMQIARFNQGQDYAFFKPDYRQIYYASREMGGGCMLDCASHFIDLVQWYMGPIKSMQGYQRHLAIPDVEVEDAVAISFEFENGALGTININQFQPLNESCIEFAGEQGFVRIIEPGFQVRIWRKGADDWEDFPTEPGDYAEALRRQAAAFLSAIAGGSPLRTSIRDAARTLRLCLDV